MPITYYAGPGQYGGLAQRTVNGLIITYPDTIAIVARLYVTLESNSTIIILPSPLFGDTQQLVGVVNINRMVDGTVYTYVKTPTRSKLTYKFELKRQKAAELQQFLDGSNTQWIYMQNFKGELWYVRVTNNPITFTATGRGYVNQTSGPYKNQCVGNIEVHQVELTFEGNLVSGAASGCIDYVVTTLPGIESGGSTLSQVVTTYTLIGPSQLISYPGGASGVFTVKLGSGTINGVVQIIPHSALGASINPPYVYISVDNPTATFTITEPANIGGGDLITTTNTESLRDPPGISVGVFPPNYLGIDVTVSGVSPANGAINVSVNTKITITFSGGVPEVIYTLIDFAVTPVVAINTYNPNALPFANTVTVGFATTLAYNTKYTITISNYSSLGPLPYTWSFTTEV